MWVRCLDNISKYGEVEAVEAKERYNNKLYNINLCVKYLSNGITITYSQK